MQSKDHYLLGCFLLEHLPLQLDPLRKHLFLFGCIEPDVNPFTYARGSMKYQFLHGHNAENAKKHLDHAIKKLLDHGVHTPMQWFAFGTALHYIADSFTFPHNDLFSGDLIEHRNYEKLLHTEFEKYLGEWHTTTALSANTAQSFAWFHTQYLSDTRSFLTDCQYIVNASFGLCETLHIGVALPDQIHALEMQNSYGKI